MVAAAVEEEEEGLRLLSLRLVPAGSFSSLPASAPPTSPGDVSPSSVRGTGAATSMPEDREVEALSEALSEALTRPEGRGEAWDEGLVDGAVGPWR